MYYGGGKTSNPATGKSLMTDMVDGNIKGVQGTGGWLTGRNGNGFGSTSITLSPSGNISIN